MPIQHGRHWSSMNGGQFRAVGIVPLVVFPHEIVPTVKVSVLRVDPPEHELPERIALHQAVEEVADLFRLPYELPLDSW